jgi:hypothetical protein
MTLAQGSTNKVKYQNTQSQWIMVNEFKSDIHPIKFTVIHTEDVLTIPTSSLGGPA